MLMNKPVYLGLPILDVSKTELWYDYVNPKYYENAILWNVISIQTASFVM